MQFRELLGKQLLFFDGATGTQLQARGLKPGEITESWNFTHPEIVEAVHKAYYDAGSNICKSNTFGANPIKLAGSGLDCKETIEAAVAIAKRAAGGRENKFVALNLGPTGKLLAPYGDLPFEKAVEAYGEMVRYGAAAGADLILIETMSDTYEIKAAILAAKENCDLPICVTMTFDEDGKLLTGATVEAAAIMCEGLGVDAIGFNCGLGPKQVAKLFGQMKAAVKLPLIVNPNAGLPRQHEGHTCYDMTSEEYSELMYDLAQQGASIVGGCCGTTPEIIAAMIEKCKDLKPGGYRENNLTAVSSYGKAVHIGDDPVIIGERINPTGKKRLKEALANNDMDYVCRLAVEQINAGSHILDVNMGAPGVDEAALLERAVPTLQAITDTPLQIDTANYDGMARALRLYNGKPMLNSVNGKEESLEKVLPLAKKYGAVVVALCLDDNGIPDTAEGRLAIADKILTRAAEVGIESRNIVVDPLAMTISTGADNAKIACEVIRVLKARGINTVMGVSNISFGLPSRDAVNSTFFTMAMQAGLSCGIINPQSKPMMDAFYGYRAVMGYDESCKDYVEHFANAPKVTAAELSELGLYDAIAKGLVGAARTAAKAALETEAPLDVINKYMIPALDFVGDGFEKKTLFLPQLLMSADAAKAAFDVIREVVSTGDATEVGEPVIIATVHGDIHDIGKNIVKVLLENYGYNVIDLGKDVPVETVVKAAIETKAKVVGLTALMTTTLPAMEDTIAALRKAVDCKIVVGGAVMTPEYAAELGAEHHAPNAVSAVNFVNSVFGK